MYPKEKGHPDNHKREYCSDGAPSSAASSHIPYPQPEGIFIKGKTFDIIPFLKAVQELYQHVVVEGVSRDDLDLEMEAFATMFMNRTEHDRRGDNGEEVVSFRLLQGVTVLGEESAADFLNLANGQTYLKVGCL